MLTISTKIIHSDRRNNSFSNRKGIRVSLPETRLDNFTKTTGMNSSGCINFKGYTPSPSNEKSIREICTLVKNLVESASKNKENVRFAITSHKNPDMDAFFSALLLKRLIKNAVGIDSDLIVMKPVPQNFRPFFQPHEVKVVHEELGTKPKVEDIKSHFGHYDAVFCLDTGHKKLFDGEIYEGIVSGAERVIKIDHHIVEPNHIEKCNYAHINLIDPTKKAAGQLLMEFVGAFGLDKSGRQFRKISDLIVAAIEGDTNFLQHEYIDGGVLRDIKELRETSNVKRIARLLKKRTPEEKRVIKAIKQNIRFHNEKQVVCSTFDAAGTPLSDDCIQRVTGIAVDEMLSEHKSNYAFIVKRYQDGRLNASLRSADGHNAFDIASKFEGGGRQNACLIEFNKGESMEEAVNLILNQVETI